MQVPPPPFHVVVAAVDFDAPPPVAGVQLVTGSAPDLQALRVASAVRAAGIKTTVLYSGRNMKKSMSVRGGCAPYVRALRSACASRTNAVPSPAPCVQAAVKAGAHAVVLVGTDEVNAGRVQVKHMGTGVQTSVSTAASGPASMADVVALLSSMAHDHTA
ncbi:hypothetical protein EON68_00905 [archaeon]|nr:MAG: hypothetical protein EON68_00905 [archaeon]